MISSYFKNLYEVVENFSHIIIHSTISDLQNLKSKSLLAAIFYRFQNRQVLRKMAFENKGIILIGIKSFIECFETI